MAAEPGPSFSCGKVQAGSIEAMICADCGWSALDRKLAAVLRKRPERRRTSVRRYSRWSSAARWVNC